MKFADNILGYNLLDWDATTLKNAFLSSIRVQAVMHIIYEDETFSTIDRTARVTEQPVAILSMKDNGTTNENE